MRPKKGNKNEFNNVVEDILKIDALNHFVKSEQNFFNENNQVKLDAKNEFSEETVLAIALKYVSLGYSNDALSLLKTVNHWPKAKLWLAYLSKDIDLEKAEIYFSAAHNELIVNIGDGQELPIRMLSDGYRNTLGMIGDIAYRMAELNPHLTTDSSGIVLIDELDLHLHPKWQRHIVNDLKTIFPNCQFIVTTHSPFIIQSLESGELLKLDETPEIEYDDFTKKGIEDIAEEFQDVEMPQRSVKFQEMLKKNPQYLEKPRLVPYPRKQNMYRLERTATMGSIYHAEYGSTLALKDFEDELEKNYREELY